MTSCILTVIKNEHEYLDEWIRYHLNLGVNHIFIFEDIDSESHKQITDKYSDNVSLAVIDSILNDTDKNIAIELKKNKKWNVQHLYFRNALLYIKNTYGDIYNWCFIIDVDEFITLENPNDKLADILSLYRYFDALVIQWKCYGANGLIKKPNYKDKGVIDTYTKEMTGVINDKPDSFIKTCHNLKSYRNELFFNQHHQRKFSNYCNTEYIKSNTSPTYKNIYIRHYITKSWEEYVWKIKVRGFTWGGARNFDFFFDVNSDMKEKKEELINSLDKNKVLVVLPYRQSRAQGIEIKLALNLWKKFCKFNYHFVVVGTFSNSLKHEFPWVEFIVSHQTAPLKNQYYPHLNVQQSMEVVMQKYDNIYKGFIWMVDDNYAIKNFNLEDITTIHYHKLSFEGDKEKPKTFWKYDKWKTRQLLDRENLPHINYTTHYPCYFEFDKLKEIWDKFDMRKESYVLEDIYFNYFKHKEPILDNTIRLGIWNKDIFDKEFQNVVNDPNIKFVCNSVEGWSKELENSLEQILKEES